MKQKLLGYLLLILLCTFPFSSFAWNKAGHMIVAQIAYTQLSTKYPQIRLKVDDIVENMWPENTEYNKYTYFIDIAHWPDDIRGEGDTTTAVWHFIDTPFSADKTPIPKYINPQNVKWVIPAVAKVVTNTQANPYDRARMLAFLIHFVGDSHQPLHCVTRITAAHPNGDLGGNLYPIHYVTKSGHEIKELHALWDAALNLYSSKGFSSYPVDPSEVAAVAAAIIKDYPESYFGFLTHDFDPQDWVTEGFNLSTDPHHVYDTVNLPMNGSPSAQYFEENDKAVEQRLALAGYRLANYLAEKVLK